MDDPTRDDEAADAAATIDMVGPRSLVVVVLVVDDDVAIDLLLRLAEES